MSAATIPAGLLEIGKLEGDGGADDGVLPIISDPQPPDPIHPIVARALNELAAGRDDILGERLVRSEDNVDRLGQNERRLAFDVGERSISGEPDREIFATIADVIAARANGR